MMQILKASLLIFLFCFPMVAEAQLTRPAEEPKETIKVDYIAMRMHADWCENTKVLTNRINNIKHFLSNSDVLFLTFDQTDEFSTAQSEKLAALLDLEKVFAKYKGRTGMLIIVDRHTGEVKQELNHRVSEGRLREIISRY